MAYIFRECSFLSKALKAEEVGALAVIVTDNEVKNDDVYLSMVDDKTNREVNIPVTFLIGKNGSVLKLYNNIFYSKFIS